MASWTVLGAVMLAASPFGLGTPPLPPPPPIHAEAAPPSTTLLAAAPPPPAADWSGLKAGSRLRINGREQRAGWRWSGEGSATSELWLPLEVLQGQLGFSSRSRSDGSLAIEWFGLERLVGPAEQRPIGDEVAIEIGAFTRALGVTLSRSGDLLELQLPPPQLLRVRMADQPGRRRVVLDLSGPATLAGSDGRLELDIQPPDPTQRELLRDLGLRPQAGGPGLVLNPSALKGAFTLGTPARIVIDLPPLAGRQGATSIGEPVQALDPRLQALLGNAVQWNRQTVEIGARRLRLNSVSVDLRASPLALKPLSRPDGMHGLTPLPLLARHHDALVAINGGYFNRVRRLPLGALRADGRWLSGPILNRGVVAWDPRGLPRFGRLQLDDWLTDGEGRRWPVVAFNSGWVQRGISRYTPEWGRVYRAMSGAEQGLLLRNGTVAQRFEADRMQAGIPLSDGDTLLVGRGGQILPWAEGERLTVSSRPSAELGQAANVMGGGPLLLLDGRVVLNGAAESFGAAFLSQGAPRTVIGSDGQRLWLVTLEGVDDEGPTLSETAVLLQRLGLRDALNLDGGSSTGLVMGGNHTVKGRGVAGVVHNGLGLVAPTPGGTAAGGS
ncbi:MAG: phosphodiester glycosidase family protein [Synechococcaceae cyanobacterium]|nr:phosphodiester glycosidase family protein [Synechococcaceae cyanobacterium]